MFSPRRAAVRIVSAKFAVVNVRLEYRFWTPEPDPWYAEDGTQHLLCPRGVWRREFDEAENSCVARFWARRPNDTKDTLVPEILDVSCDPGFCFEAAPFRMRAEIHPVSTSWWTNGVSVWG